MLRLSARVFFIYALALDLSPRDDLESLAYIALFLLRGNLPWKPRLRKETQLRSQEIVRRMKYSWSGQDLCGTFPAVYGELLDYSRSLQPNQALDYARFKHLVASWVSGKEEGPLDWTPCNPQLSDLCIGEPKTDSLPPEDDIDDDDTHSSLGWVSYIPCNVDMWELQGERRDKDLTLLIELSDYLDSCTHQIVEVLGMLPPSMEKKPTVE